MIMEHGFGSVICWFEFKMELGQKDLLVNIKFKKMLSGRMVLHQTESSDFEIYHIYYHCYCVIG